MTLDYWIKGKSERKTIDDYVAIVESLVTDSKVTFSDNIDEPVHRWIRFPAGFSADLVRRTFAIFNVRRGMIVLDPFTGSGTLNVEAKRRGVDSLDVEAHPLLAKIARVKVYWDYDLPRLREYAERLHARIRSSFDNREYLKVSVDNVPELLFKVYDEETLRKLYYVKAAIEEAELPRDVRDFFELALIAILRKTTDVDVGWPYILPRKKKRKAREVYEAFVEQVRLMISDLEIVRREAREDTKATIYEGDARNMREVGGEETDFIFTSPPYLNNYDYADRTRLELYFLGWCRTWSEITEKIRSRLIIASTTQVERSTMEYMRPSKLIPGDVAEEIWRKVLQLREERGRHGGRKDYDLMVLGYFNDMVLALREMARVLKPDHYTVMILGDSAPYGVYIPTPEYLGRIAVNVGFKDYRVVKLRRRGHKWRYIQETGRRHNVELGEYMLILRK
ncbi:MAG: hypothetical protein ACP5N5_06260 [Desulfurococcus sp.]